MERRQQVAMRLINLFYELRSCFFRFVSLFPSIWTLKRQETLRCGNGPENHCADCFQEKMKAAVRGLLAEKVANGKGCARGEIDCDGFAQSHDVWPMGNAYASVVTEGSGSATGGAFPFNCEMRLGLRV